MLLRKHLTGGRLVGLHMNRGTASSILTSAAPTRWGTWWSTPCRRTDGPVFQPGSGTERKIIDALKRVDFEDSEIRQLLPGLPYTLPPKPGKPDFLAVSGAQAVSLACRRDLPPADALTKSIGGVGPVVMREIALAGLRR